jgi:hypothetical protein
MTLIIDVIARSSCNEAISGNGEGIAFLHMREG